MKKLILFVTLGILSMVVLIMAFVYAEVKSTYDRGRADGIAECEKNCAPATVAGSLDLGPCSLEQEGTVSGGSEGSAFQYYYCNGSKWVIAREFNIMAYPKPGTITASPEACTGYPWTYEPGYACLEGGITRIKDGYICHDVGGVPKCVSPHPIRKPAPKPKPCDPCEGIKKLDARLSEVERRLQPPIEYIACTSAPELCAPVSAPKGLDSSGTVTIIPDKDGNFTLVPGGPRFTFDNPAIGGPCITCSITPATPCGGLPCATMSTPPYHDLQGTTINGTSEPTKYVAPASNGPGALLLYAPPPGLHVDSHTTATPEPRTLLLAAGGLTAIYALRKSA